MAEIKCQQMLILNKSGKPLGVRTVFILRDAMMCEGLGVNGKKVAFLLEPAKKEDIIEGA